MVSLLFPFVSRPIVQELNLDHDIKVRYIVADMPERHTLRGLIAIQGRCSCEFCKGRGDTGGGISWPCPKYWKCPLRDHDEMEGIARYPCYFCVISVFVWSS